MSREHEDRPAGRRHELLPEAMRQIPNRRSALGWIAAAFTAMLAFQTYLLA